MERSLRRHGLHHVGALKVDDNILDGRFAGSCATSRCKGSCCESGVWVDVSERDRVVANADLVREQMDLDQEQRADHWFDAETTQDTDFPSAQAVGTRLHNGACVFLNSARRCVLQIAGEQREITLKPFFCTAFPIVVCNGKLAVDEGLDTNCCSLVAEGELDVFDVCSEELKHVLGEEGRRELRLLVGKDPA